MVDMVSQFEVSDLYSQINYQGKTGSCDSTGLRKPDQMADQPVAGNPGVYYDRYDDTGYLAGQNWTNRSAIPRQNI